VHENQVYHQLGQMGLGWQESVDLLGKAMANAAGKRGPISTLIPRTDMQLVYDGAAHLGVSHWSITERPVLSSHQLVMDGYQIFRKTANMDEDQELEEWFRQVKRYIKADRTIKEHP